MRINKTVLRLGRRKNLKRTPVSNNPSKKMMVVTARVTAVEVRSGQSPARIQGQSQNC